MNLSKCVNGKRVEIHEEGARALLNLPGHHSTAAIVGEVVYSKGVDREVGSVEAELVISDCSRTITLWFNPEDLGEHQNDLHKVDTMVTVLTAFRKALVRAQKHAERTYAAKQEKAA